MKKVVTALLLFAFCTVQAQGTYEAVLNDGLTWKMEYGSISYPETEFHYWCRNIVLRNDTIVDGIPFMRAYRESKSEAGDIVLEPEGYMIGQKGGVVYQYEENENWEQKYYPIMDFSLNIGDEFSICEEDPFDDEQRLWELDKFKVVAVSDTVLPCSTDLRPRRCVYVQSAYSQERKDYWVEGIGSLRNGIIGRREYHLGRGRLVRCSQGDDVLYFTNSATGIDEAQVQSPSGNACHDLQGRRLAGCLARGLFIQNGKVHIMR